MPELTERERLALLLQSSAVPSHRWAAEILMSDVQALAASEQRNRELTRQVEQLQAKVDASKELISQWRRRAPLNHSPVANTVYTWAAEELEAALAAPPSSAPTDLGLADTGRDER